MKIVLDESVSHPNSLRHGIYKKVMPRSEKCPGPCSNFNPLFRPQARDNSKNCGENSLGHTTKSEGWCPPCRSPAAPNHRLTTRSERPAHVLPLVAKVEVRGLGGQIHRSTGEV
jgi:hypothetical protein